MHRGNTETWIQARAALKSGRGLIPRHGRGGRRAAPPTGFKLAVLGRKLGGRTWHGWTADSVDHAARIGAI